MAADAVVADTHALLWWLSAPERLSDAAREAMDGAASISVSSISFWEVGMLASQGRIALDRPLARWVNDVVASGEVVDAAVTAPIGAAAAALRGLHGDPADRMIAATALSIGAPIVTKDAQLHAWASTTSDVTAIW